MTDRPLDMFWFIPVSGDGSYLGSDKGIRYAEFDYMKEIAQAADRLGFAGALLPVGSHCEDPWITAAALAPHTKRLRFLAALRPGLATPTHWARQTAALDRISEGRFLVNVVSGGDPVELAGDGIFLSHDARYAHAAEFLTVFRRLLAGETVDFVGEHIRVEGARLLFPTVQSPLPIWFGGSSDAGLEVAGEHADVYLTWGEPPAQVAEKIEAARKRAALRGRTLKFGLRIHIIVRETESEAWDAADRLIAHLSDDAIAAAQRKFALESDSDRPKADERSAWRPPRPTRDRAQSLGWRRPRAARRRHRAGRRSRDGRRALARISGARNRYGDRLRLSASRGGL